jgi:hypothetical protein
MKHKQSHKNQVVCASIEEDPEWLQLRQVDGAISSGFQSMLEKYAPDDLQQGYREFTDDGFNKINKETFYDSMFMQWFCFVYLGELSDSRTVTYAEFFLEEKHKDLSEYEKKFLKCATRVPFSFYLVEDVIFGRRIRLYDILREKPITIKEARRVC